jgi:DNA-binding NarL/FixJ family response regulator
MPLDPANEGIVVLSKFLYRAESLAHELSERTGYRVTAVDRPDPAVLASFGTVLIDMDSTFEIALELIRGVVVRRPQTRVLLLGLEESAETVIKLAEAGASGYATAGTSLEALVAIVRSVENSEFNCPPHITYALQTHLARLADAERALPRLPVLTIREQRVLDLLSQNLTNKEIAASLCISEYTAKNHVHRILKKLGWSSRSLATGSGAGRAPASGARSPQPRS